MGQETEGNALSGGCLTGDDEDFRYEKTQGCVVHLSDAERLGDEPQTGQRKEGKERKSKLSGNIQVPLLIRLTFLNLRVRRTHRSETERWESTCHKRCKGVKTGTELLRGVLLEVSELLLTASSCILRGGRSVGNR